MRAPGPDSIRVINRQITIGFTGSVVLTVEQASQLHLFHMRKLKAAALADDYRQHAHHHTWARRLETAIAQHAREAVRRLVA